MYFTYVLRSKVDGKLYVGFCKDLETRLKQHNRGQVKSTKNRAPFVLIYYEACLDITKAVNREKYFKTGFGRYFLKKRI